LKRNRFAMAGAVVFAVLALAACNSEGVVRNKPVDDCPDQPHKQCNFLMLECEIPGRSSADGSPTFQVVRIEVDSDTWNGITIGDKYRGCPAEAHPKPLKTS
jgi:hypothetical protein